MGKHFYRWSIATPSLPFLAPSFLKFSKAFIFHHYSLDVPSLISERTIRENSLTKFPCCFAYFHVVWSDWSLKIIYWALGPNILMCFNMCWPCCMVFYRSNNTTFHKRVGPLLTLPYMYACVSPNGRGHF